MRISVTLATQHFSSTLTSQLLLSVLLLPPYPRPITRTGSAGQRRPRLSHVLPSLFPLSAKEQDRPLQNAGHP